LAVAGQVWKKNGQDDTTLSTTVFLQDRRAAPLRTPLFSYDIIQITHVKILEGGGGGRDWGKKKGERNERRSFTTGEQLEKWIWWKFRVI